MAEFMLESASPAASPTSQLRIVSSGLAPTADIPVTRQKKEPPICYAPCPHCQAEVLKGQTRAGTTLLLDIHTPTYCVVWDNGAAVPRLEESQGYPVHQCH